MNEDPAATFSESTPSPLQGVLEALGLALAEADSEGALKLACPLPGWYRDSWGEGGPGPLQAPDRYPFLSNFLIDARQFWDSGRQGTLESGAWVEQLRGDETLHLEAFAVNQKLRRLLLLQVLGPAFQERVDLLQKARENSLVHSRLIKEIQHKEILLHCIVHDLAGPLMGISSSLSLLDGETLSEAGRRRLSIGRRASDRLEDLIRGILDVFSAEIEDLTEFSPQSVDPPDLSKCAGRVLETLAPAAALREVELDLSPSPGEGLPGVVAEENRLERVLYNLVQNALRYAPPGSRVVVAVQTEAPGSGSPSRTTAPGSQPHFAPSSSES